jgi:hypothetical protein
VSTVFGGLKRDDLDIASSWSSSGSCGRSLEGDVRTQVAGTSSERDLSTDVGRNDCGRDRDDLGRRAGSVGRIVLVKGNDLNLVDDALGYGRERV